MLSHLEQIANRVSRWFSWISGIALIAMMFIVCLNVFLRVVYRPILGTYEIVGFLSVLVVSLGLAYTTVKQGHVEVDLFVRSFPPRLRGAVHCFTSFLSFVLFGLLAWYSFIYGMKLLQFGNLSQTLRIPFYPLVFGLALASGLTGMILLFDFMKLVYRLLRK